MRVAAGFLLMFTAAQPALAQPIGSEPPPAFKKLIDCRSIGDAAERLACYDREIAAVDTAVTQKELVVFDRSQVQRTQRTLFGLPLPNLNIFGDGSGDAPSEISSTIKRAWMHDRGKWAFELADGARWEQVDTTRLVFEPEAGQEVKIRRAAMGSYLANVDRQTAIRVRRVQ